MELESKVIHQCCGCSCDVCADHHNANPGHHTTKCWDRFLKEAEEDNNLRG